MIRRILLSAALLAPVSASAKCYEQHDKFEGTTLHWCAMGWLGKGEQVSMSGDPLAPIPMASVKNSSDITFAIKALWQNSSWLFMSPGTKLIFILDDASRIELVTRGGSTSSREINTTSVGIMVREEAIFSISAAEMQRLASAQRAEFAIYGKKGRFEGSLDAKALKYYRELYDTVLPPGP